MVECSHKPLHQLVAAATMFIASKLADPCPITGTELVRYTNDTYNLIELLVSEFHEKHPCQTFFWWFWGISGHPQVSPSIPGYARDARLTSAC